MRLFVWKNCRSHLRTSSSADLFFQRNSTAILPICISFSRQFTAFIVDIISHILKRTIVNAHNFITFNEIFNQTSSKFCLYQDFMRYSQCFSYHKKTRTYYSIEVSMGKIISKTSVFVIHYYIQLTCMHGRIYMLWDTFVGQNSKIENNNNADHCRHYCSMSLGICLCVIITMTWLKLHVVS